MRAYFPEAPRVAPLPLRATPIIAPATITRVPLYMGLGYVALTFALFLLWPVSWPIYTTWEWASLTLYMLLCLSLIAAGAIAGSAGPTQLAAPLPGIPLLLIAGAAVSAALLIPSCIVYTGRGPWEVMDALRDQGAAYRRFQIELYYGQGTRTFMVAMRVLAGPLMYSVLPLAVIHWRRIGWLGRAAVVVTATCSIIFSIMRGTDKEIADLLVVGFAALLVSMGRSLTISGRKSIVRRYWFAGVLGLVFLFAGQSLFTERKYERLGGYEKRSSVCVANSRICTDLDDPLITWLPIRERFGLSMFILYTTSGYFGLHLAMQKPFESALGVGHSPSALTLYEAATGDEEPHKRTYTYRIGADQWPEDNNWSTLITWIANDVGFGGAVLVLGLVGLAWGTWWREAAAGMSDPAAILFVQAMTMVFYLPANNQLFVTHEGYSIFLVWLAVWWWHRSTRRIYAGLPVPSVGAL